MRCMGTVTLELVFLGVVRASLTNMNQSVLQTLIVHVSSEAGTVGSFGAAVPEDSVSP